jgi:hypothetical protein
MKTRPIITIMREEDGWTVDLAFQGDGLRDDPVSKESHLVHSLADALALIREYVIDGRLPIGEWNAPPINPEVKP